MGCWSETCGFSHLPINHGDKVMCFVIRENRYGDPSKRKATQNYCYPYDPFEPYLLPVIGKYDDYGCVEEVKDNVASAFLLEHFEQKLSSGKFDNAGWSEYDPKPEKFETIEVLLNHIERGHLYENSGSIFYGYRLYMVHFDIFKTLTKISVKKSEMAKASWKRSETDVDDRMFGLLFSNEKNKIILEMRTPEEEKLVEKLRSKWSDDRLDLGRSVDHRFNDLGKLLPFLPTESYYQDLQNLMQYVVVVSRTRRSFAPTAGTGSQDNDLVWHKKAQKVINAQIKKREDEIEQWEYENEDA